MICIVLKMTSASPNLLLIDEISVPNFKAQLYIYCRGSDCHLPSSVTWHQPHIINDCGNLFVFFSQSSLSVSLDQTKVPASSPCLIDWRFISEYPFNPIIHSPWLLLFSPTVTFFLGFSDGLRLASLDVKKIPVSYSSVTNIDFCFYPWFSFILLRIFYSQTFCFEFSLLMLQRLP